jgi:hypothetical protein
MFFITFSRIVFTISFFSFSFLSYRELFPSLWIQISRFGFFFLIDASCYSSLIYVIFCLWIRLFIMDRN